MNNIIEKQLQLIEADLSNFNAEENTFIIPRKRDIKIEEDTCYLVHCKPTLFINETLKVNWNSGSLPSEDYLIVFVNKIMGKMIKVDSVGYDAINKKDTAYHWSGWLTLADLDIIQKM